MEENNVIQGQLQKQVDDHEDRLRTLENNSTEMKFNLMSIEKGQMDLKLMMTQNIADNRDDNRQIFNMLEKFINSDIDSKKVNQKNLWDLLFKIWAVLAPVIAVLATILDKYSK